MRSQASVLSLVAALAILAPRVAAARDAPSHPFGLGLVLGEPTGLTAKLYLPQPFALQFGVGFVDDFDGRDGLDANLDFLWHPAILARTPALTMPFYIGVGARLADFDHDYIVNGVRYVDHDTRLGVRMPFGLLIDFTRAPLDLYFELALVVDLVYFDETYGPYHTRDRVGFNGGVGLRYYF
jgi:hypothetical protein